MLIQRNARYLNRLIIIPQNWRIIFSFPPQLGQCYLDVAKVFTLFTLLSYIAQTSFDGGGRRGDVLFIILLIPYHIIYFLFHDYKEMIRKVTGNVLGIFTKSCDKVKLDFDNSQFIVV